MAHPPGSLPYLSLRNLLGVKAQFGAPLPSLAAGMGSLHVGSTQPLFPMWQSYILLLQFSAHQGLHYLVGLTHIQQWCGRKLLWHLEWQRRSGQCKWWNLSSDAGKAGPCAILPEPRKHFAFLLFGHNQLCLGFPLN